MKRCSLSTPRGPVAASKIAHRLAVVATLLVAMGWTAPAGAADPGHMVMIAQRIDVGAEPLQIDNVKLSFVALTSSYAINTFDLVIAVGKADTGPCAELCLDVEQMHVFPVPMHEGEILETGQIWVNIPLQPSIWKYLELEQSVIAPAERVVMVGLQTDLESLDPEGFIVQSRVVGQASKSSWLSDDGGASWQIFAVQAFQAPSANKGSSYIQIEVHPGGPPPQ